MIIPPRKWIEFHYHSLYKYKTRKIIPRFKGIAHILDVKRHGKKN